MRDGTECGREPGDVSYQFVLPLLGSLSLSLTLGWWSEPLFNRTKRQPSGEPPSGKSNSGKREQPAMLVALVVAAVGELGELGGFAQARTLADTVDGRTESGTHKYTQRLALAHK